MLFLLIKWIYFTILSFIYGFSIAEQFKYLNIKTGSEKVHPSLLVFLGFAVITTITAYLTLFMKVGACANLVMFIIGALLLIQYFRLIQDYINSMKEKFLQLDKFKIVLIFSTAMACLWISVHNSLNNDEGGYYAQFILWTETYPVVPGLVNLQDRLGFNSHWHLFSALTNLSWITHQESNEINGLVWLLASIFFLTTITKARDQHTDFLKLTFVFFIFLPIPYLFYVMICPSADMLIMILTWVLYSIWLDRAASSNLFEWDAHMVISIIISFFLITTKPSAIPLLIIPCSALLYNFMKENKKGVVLLTAFVTVMISIWFIRNVILSGYLIYPFDKIDLFNPDWKGLMFDLLRQKKRIYDFGFNLYGTKRIDVSAMPYFQKIYIWYTNNLLHYDRFLIACDIVSLLLILIFRKQFNKFQLFVFTVLYISIAFWFSQSPDPRFAYGPIGFMAMTAIYLLFYGKDKNKVISVKVVNFFMVFILLFQLTALFFFDTLENKMTYQKKKEVTCIAKTSIFLMPMPYPTFPLDSMIINGQKYYYNMKNKGINWDAPLPAFHRTIHNSIKLRGKSLKDGFYHSTNDTTEIILIPYEMV